MVLYGITGTLFAYCVSLVLTNSLAAFAVLAAYQVIIFGVCLSSFVFAVLIDPTVSLLSGLALPGCVPFGADLRKIHGGDQGYEHHS